ncbi:quinolinate synthase NadA [Rhizobium oryzihabitans]|uniref:quinolinate synthase NadA n=1 Tax=Rhizobium oryzihabitans TaxID=2267833 RepID=UPI003CCD977C
MNEQISAASLYDRVSRVIPKAEWMGFQDDVEAILELKHKRNAVILAHNYQTPEIFHGVADIVGDSLALARKAMEVEADVIVLAGVHFMAETAKLLNPEKTVLIPDMAAGCSLADSITPEDIALLRKAYPGVPVVTYVNTSAAVKAASDICCTSGNARQVVESLGVPRVLMLPDEYLAKNVARETNVELIAWRGHCEVHELFTADDIRELRESHPGVTVLAHPECPPDVVEAADFSGSTAVMRSIRRSQSPPAVRWKGCWRYERSAVAICGQDGHRRQRHSGPDGGADAYATACAASDAQRPRRRDIQRLGAGRHCGQSWRG